MPRSKLFIVNAVFNTSEGAVEWAVRGGELVDSAGYFRVFDQGWGVVGFDSCIDDQGASAPPVFLFGE